MPLVAGVRWSFRGKDAGSARIDEIRVRLRTRPRGEQRGPAAQTVFRQALLTMLLAHGGVAGAIVEVSIALLIVAIALAAWVGSRKDQE